VSVTFASECSQPSKQMVSKAESTFSNLGANVLIAGLFRRKKPKMPKMPVRFWTHNTTIYFYLKYNNLF
jgi:hypothetical protein